MKNIRTTDYWFVDGDPDDVRYFTDDYQGPNGALESAVDRCFELQVPWENVRHEDAQRRFVNALARAAAYIGGLGSGKTFAGIARGLLFSQQPMPPGQYAGPRGVVAAVSYPVLDDIVLPVFFEMMDGAGLWKTGKQETSWVSTKRNARLIANCGCKDRQACKHEAIIRFRSLDNPAWMRGQELTWFFIDEGRHISMKAWEVLWGRLRQTGFERAGWVCSTPNGYDWMWQRFHPDGPKWKDGTSWYNASTMANKQNLPDEYIQELVKEYEGAFLRQEVYGEFMGVTEGAVFYAFKAENVVRNVPYDPDLPLYSTWDFGMGDETVCLFIQIAFLEKLLDDGSKHFVPRAHIIGAMVQPNRTSGVWTYEFNRYCEREFGGRRPQLNIGDPAGGQRNQVTGTSVIEDFAQHGLIITPAPKKPQDTSIRILNNMMEADRVLVDQLRAAAVAAAISSHQWPMDPAGNRTGIKPVHDWSSHFCDALRYWALVVIGTLGPRREPRIEPEPPGPGTMGYLVNRILAPPSSWLNNDGVDPLDEWEPGVLVRRGDRIVTSGE